MSAASIRTSTSPGPGSGTGTCSIRTSPGPWKMAARMRGHGRKTTFSARPPPVPVEALGELRERQHVGDQVVDPDLPEAISSSAARSEAGVAEREPTSTSSLPVDRGRAAPARAPPAPRTAGRCRPGAAGAERRVERARAPSRRRSRAARRSRRARSPRRRRPPAARRRRRARGRCRRGRPGTRGEQPADRAAAGDHARARAAAARRRGRCSRAARRTSRRGRRRRRAARSTTVPTWLAGATSSSANPPGRRPGGEVLRAAGLVAREAVRACAARHAVGERDPRAGRERAGLDDAGQLVAEHRPLDAGAVGELLDVGAAEADGGHADEDLAVARVAARGRRAAPSSPSRPSTTARIRSTPRIVRRRRAPDAQRRVSRRRRAAPAGRRS